MRKFQPFDLERIMNRWENRVDYNLTESGVHPIGLRELLNDPELEIELLETTLGYPECNGSIELRENIARLYPGADASNVLVTVGCAEANFLSVQTVLAPGDEVLVMIPNYLQIWGLAHNLGLNRSAFHLGEEQGWAPDLSELETKASADTRLIAVCNPNNPTGHILSTSDMESIIGIADRSGAWILADETYAGSERLMDDDTPTFWGTYERVLVTSSLSKAYGLPGLRIGWVVGPSEVVEDIWERHDYAAISTTMLSNRLGAIALSPQVRPLLIQRGREYIRRGYSTLEDWIAGGSGDFSVVPPQAAAIAFVRYEIEINSTQLVDQLISEESVFVVPGDCFGVDRHLRISFGMPQAYLQAGLERISSVIAELKKTI
jgi:aspartate/methionine/tyrosine aminotransferase